MSKLKAIKPAVQDEEEFLNVNPGTSSDEDDDQKHSSLLDAINKLETKKR